ncbi:MAG: peptidoglycan DD-metalloendopeptidase family protein [Chloroflexi bacterium]|nr:peptidoglycan DD-metalloendopeptidase family protein [Chloroflexota bacterium]
MHFRLNLVWMALLGALMVALSARLGPISAQPAQCGIAQTINFPVDMTRFTAVQTFGAPSPRHQGRYHTGEDYYGPRGATYGAFVYAAAAGRVTFSSPNGWGRDGGVVIIEHTFPDGSIAYSQYGHLTDETGIEFPAVFACIREGEVIATIGDVRPAPHLHFEIRTRQPNIPGPGYTWADPRAEGWRDPSKFIRNWQTWLGEGIAWRLDLADEAGPVTPPVELDDHSLIYIDSTRDAGRVLRATPDGRVLWRVLLEAGDGAPLALAPHDSGALIIFADGTLQPVHRDGSLQPAWATGVTLSSAANPTPIRAGDLLLFSTPDEALIALDAAAQTVRWRLDDVAPVVRWAAADTFFGVVTAADELLTLSPQGTLIDRARLREPGALIPAPDGGLWAYISGGLWSIDPGGGWSLALYDAPPGGASAAVTLGPDGRLYLFSSDTTLYAYERIPGGAPTRDRDLLWQTALPGVAGQVDLALYDGILLLTSSHGHITAVRAAGGEVCNRAHIFGNQRARLWHSFGADGVLRLFVADQILGIDWDDFLLACG